MVRKALLVAYHYPPVSISSGVQRTLAFSQYLGRSGWEPIVLTVHPRAYQVTSDDQLGDIPEGLIVKRAFALDTGRHLAIKGRYIGLMAIPDRWVSWWFAGVLSGLRLIRQHRPDVIWSTYPIATAHLIGVTLSKLTGIPLVADFRDSMLDESYPKQKRMRYVHQMIERWTLQCCRFAVFTTPGAVRLYSTRYPDLPKERLRVIPNGYNEAIFSELESPAGTERANIETNQKKPVVLVHSGVIYPEERDPKPFFRAISELKREKCIQGSEVRIILRASGHDDLYTHLIADYAIQDIVQLQPGLGYRDALREILDSDGLLILQASSCNHQIPAKIYEYFRAGKPILALTDSSGDTAGLLTEAGIDSIVPLNDVGAIKTALSEFLNKLEQGNISHPNQAVAIRYSRESGAGQLADIFTEALG